MSLLVICGPVGAGKTTLLRQQVGVRAAAGQSVGGIASPAVFEDGRRAGYDLIELRTGQRRPLARVAAAPGMTPLIGRYWFDEAAIAAGNEAVIGAVRDGLEVIALDEVGPLEFAGGGWAPALDVALAADDGSQELMIVCRSALCDALPDRFPSPRWQGAARVSPR